MLLTITIEDDCVQAAEHFKAGLCIQHLRASGLLQGSCLMGLCSPAWQVVYASWLPAEASMQPGAACQGHRSWGSAAAAALVRGWLLLLLVNGTFKDGIPRLQLAVSRKECALPETETRNSGAERPNWLCH